MTKNLRRVYWDTSVFLCFLSKAEKARRLIADDVLRHARDGRQIICTSTWTIVEVIRPKGLPPGVPLTPKEVAILNGMFQWPFIKKYQVHEGVAFKASEIARDFGLKPADAIHAATAIMCGADALQRWDRDFNKVASLITVEEPVRLSAQLTIFDDADPVGPTPESFPSVPKDTPVVAAPAPAAQASPATASSTSPAPPAGHSPGAAPESKKS